MISEVSKRRGIQKPPANELVKFASLVASFTPTEHGVLNAAGVNLILMEEGRGIRCMGARTLWPNADRKQYLNVRSILNGVKRGLKEFGKAIAFEASDDLLWKYIQTEGNKWMEQRWKDGWFFPRNDKTKAFFFKCDATTNTEELRLSAKVRSVVGINPVLPGELIQFELMLWDGGVVAVNEL
jgi:phage tail sheath protein FI